MFLNRKPKPEPHPEPWMLGLVTTPKGWFRAWDKSKTQDEIRRVG